MTTNEQMQAQFCPNCRRVAVMNQPPDYVFGVAELNKLISERIAKLCDDCREKTVLLATTTTSRS